MTENLITLQNVVVKSIREYFQKFETSGIGGINPLMIKGVEENLANIESAQKKIVAITNIDVAALFKIGALLLGVYKLLKRTIRVLETGRFNLSEIQSSSSSSSKYNLTQSYIENLSERHTEITRAYSEYRLAFNSFTPATLCPIKSLNDLNRAKEIYRSYLETNDGGLVIRVYCDLLRACLSSGIDGVDSTRLITQDLEEIKSNILIAPPDLSTNKKRNIIQRLIQKFGLVPDAPARALVDICNELSPGAKTMEEVIKVLSANNVARFGFILIDKVLYSPIEHNIWILLDKQYCEHHKLGTPPNAGVGEISLRRAATIQPREPVKKVVMKLKINDNHHDKLNPDNNFHFVIESIDGENYRIMVPRYVSFGHQINRWIPAQWLEGLDNLDEVPSVRVRGYNNILEDELIGKHLSEPFVELSSFSRSEIKREDVYWRNLRGQIKNRILREISDKITSRGANVGKIEKIIISRASKIAMIITDQLSAEYISASEGVLAASDEQREQWKTELFISYFRDMDKIRYGVQREISALFGKDEYKARFARAHSGVDMLKILDELLLEVLDKFINRRSGVYIAINNKATLLEKTLIAVPKSS